MTGSARAAQLREQVQAGIMAQEEQYPPGPAELEAADPETMPSELEAIDALQRVFKARARPRRPCRPAARAPHARRLASSVGTFWNWLV